MTTNQNSDLTARTANDGEAAKLAAMWESFAAEQAAQKAATAKTAVLPRTAATAPVPAQGDTSPLATGETWSLLTAIVWGVLAAVIGWASSLAVGPLIFGPVVAAGLAALWALSHVRGATINRRLTGLSVPWTLGSWLGGWGLGWATGTFLVDFAATAAKSMGIVPAATGFVLVGIASVGLLVAAARGQRAATIVAIIVVGFVSMFMAQQHAALKDPCDEQGYRSTYPVACEGYDR